MKILRALVLLICLAVPSRAAVTNMTVQVNLTDWQTRNVSKRLVTIEALNTPATSTNAGGSAAALSDTFRTNTPTSGTFFLSNVVAGSYLLTAAGEPKTSFTFLVTNTTELLNAWDCRTSTPATGSATTGYTRDQANAAFIARTSGVGTNTSLYGPRLQPGAGTTGYIWTLTNATTGAGSWVIAPGVVGGDTNAINAITATNIVSSMIAASNYPATITAQGASNTNHANTITAATSNKLAAVKLDTTNAVAYGLTVDSSTTVGGLVVSGDVTVTNRTGDGSVTVEGSVTAGSFYGNGVGLTNLSGWSTNQTTTATNDSFAGNISAVRFTGLHSGWISANDVWGVNGDGVTDNTSALLAMRTWLRSNDNQRITFTNGTYLYSTPFWLMSVRNIEIDGGDAAFINTANYTNHVVEAFALAINAAYFWNLGTGIGNEYGTRIAEEEPDLINSVAAGATNIALLTATSTNKFGSNEWAFVYGWTGIAQSAIPLFKELVRIHSFSAGGVVNFQAPLKNNYDARWFGVQGAAHGAPAAIVSLDRDRFRMAERIVLRNMRFKGWPPNNLDDFGNDHQGQGMIQASSANEIILDHIETGNLTCGQNGSVVVTRSKIGFSEPDTMIGSIRFDDCDIEYLVGVTGVGGLEVNNCRLLTQFKSAANNTVLQNCDIYSTGGGANPPFQLDTSDGSPVNSFSVVDCRFWQDVGTNMALINSGGERWFFCESSDSATNLYTTDLLTNRWNISLAPGKKLTQVSGTNEGVVLNVVTNGSATNYIIEASFTRQPIVGEAYRFAIVKDISIVNPILAKGASTAPTWVIYPNAERISRFPETTNHPSIHIYATNGTGRNLTTFGLTNFGMVMNGNTTYPTGSVWNIGAPMKAPRKIYVGEALLVGSNAVTSTPGDVGIARDSAPAAGYLNFGNSSGKNFGWDGSVWRFYAGSVVPASTTINLGVSTEPWSNSYARFFYGSGAGLSNLVAQPPDATLTNLAALADGAGMLTNNGAGVLGYMTIPSGAGSTNLTDDGTNVIAQGDITAVNVNAQGITISNAAGGFAAVRNADGTNTVELDGDTGTGTFSNVVAQAFTTPSATNFAVGPTGNGVLGGVAHTNGTLTTAGRGGYGTNNPQAKLHVVGDGSEANLLSLGTTAADGRFFVLTNGNIQNSGSLTLGTTLAVGSGGSIQWNATSSPLITRITRGVSLLPGIGNGTNHFQILSTNTTTPRVLFAVTSNDTVVVNGVRIDRSITNYSQSSGITVYGDRDERSSVTNAQESDITLLYTNSTVGVSGKLAAVCDDTPHTISFAHEPHITLVVLTNSLTGYGGTNFSMAADKRLWVMWDIERENAMKTNLTVWGISQ